MIEKENDRVVMSVGGSLLYPDPKKVEFGYNLEFGIDVPWTRDWMSLVYEQAQKGREFYISIGGGYVCRQLQNAGALIMPLTEEQKDLIGIEVTRMNANFIKTLFGKDRAYDKVVDDPNSKEISQRNIMLYCGGKPGHSTDYDAVRIAMARGTKRVINMSNVDHVCDKDPSIGDAQRIKEISWENYIKVLNQCGGGKWKAGLNSPFDPVASREAQAAGIEVLVIGKNLENLRKVLEGKEFVGTRIY